MDLSHSARFRLPVEPCNRDPGAAAVEGEAEGSSENGAGPSSCFSQPPKTCLFSLAPICSGSRVHYLLISHSFFLLFLFCFLGPHPRHMNIPRLGRGGIRATATHLRHSHSTAGSEPRLRHSSAAHTNAESLTHRVRLGIELLSSRILVRFVSAVPQQELPHSLFL